MSERDFEVKSTRDDEWLHKTDDAPNCNKCDTEMYERNSTKSGGPTTPTFDVIFECPECGYQLHTTRRRE